MGTAGVEFRLTGCKSVAFVTEPRLLFPGLESPGKGPWSWKTLIKCIILVLKNTGI